jgi:hypothetical protein
MHKTIVIATAALFTGAMFLGKNWDVKSKGLQ